MKLSAQEQLELLKTLSTLTEVSNSQVNTIFVAYRTIINPNTSHLCSSCPASIRKAFNSLMIYYKNNKERLEKEVTEEAEKQKKDKVKKTPKKKKTNNKKTKTKKNVQTKQKKS